MTFGTRILLTVLSAILSIITARILGPEGRGVFAIIVAIGAIGVQFGNFGMTAANTFYVSRDRKYLSPLLGNSLLLVLFVGIIGSFIAWIFFQVFPQYAPTGGIQLILGLIWIPFGLLFLFSQNFLLAVSAVRAYNIIEVVNSLLIFVLIGILILLGRVSPELMYVANLIALIISVGLLLWRLSRYVTNGIKFSWKYFKMTFGYAAKSFFASFFMFLVLRVDLFMINAILGEEAAGHYSISVAMSDMIYLFPMIVSTLFFPHLSSILDMKVKWKSTKKVLKILSSLMFVVTLTFVLIAKPLIALLFGATFIPAAAPFVWLMPAIFLFTIGVTLSNFVASIHIPIIAPFYAAAMAFFNIILNFVLIPKYGISGAAMASLATYGLLIPINAYYSRKYLRDTTR